MLRRIGSLGRPGTTFAGPLLTAYALAIFCHLAIGTAVAAPQAIAELTLHPQPSQSKSLPDKQPLFGDYLASGDGSASGALVGRLAWDLYEETSNDERHPAYFQGFLERDGERYPFEIIGLYTPESPDRRRWRITAAITFVDDRVLRAKQALLTGMFDAGTNSAHFTIWADGPR